MITKEQVHVAYDNLPEGLREFLFSSKTVDAIDIISAENHLSAERAQIVWRVTATVILGLTHPEDLQKHIAEDAQIDPRVAKAIADAIKTKILAQISDALNKQHGFGLTTPQPQTPPNNPPISQDIPVNVQRTSLPSQQPPTPPQGVSAPQQASPFVIHEHTPVEKITSVEGNKYEGGLVHPSFFTSPGGDIPSEETTVARLEIGSPETQEEAQTTRVGKENARVVHYSAPQTPADPFSGAASIPQTEASAEKKNVPLDNVVNLKDLPQ